MDPLCILGPVLALAAILGGQYLEGGRIVSLLQLPAFLIVLGGTTGAVMLQSPPGTFMDGLRLLRWIARPPRIDLAGSIPPVLEWAALARREGMLALDRRIRSVAEEYTRKGLQMLADGFPPEKIGEALEIEIRAFEERYRAAARVWEAAGGYSPTIGILGAVLGLIHVMENLSDPAKVGDGIAVAFVATVYGVGLANLVLLPIASKLKTLVAAEVRRRELLMDGMVGIAAGDNPRLLEARLGGHLAA